MTIFRSSQPILRDIYDFGKGMINDGIEGRGMFGGIGGSIRNAMRTKSAGPMLDDAGQEIGSLWNAERKGIWEGVKDAHRATGDEWELGGYSVSKIAGSYIGVSAAGRLATGGGIYKDSDGNANVIGVPLI